MRAGFGVATITPTPPVHLAGFGARTEPAHSIHDELEARALFLEDGDCELCLVVCDLLALSRDNDLRVRSAIASELEIHPAGIIVSCTHTHSGPSGISGSERIGWPIPEGWVDVLRAGCVRAASDARDSARDASLRFARAPLPDGFAFNRRGLPYDDPWMSMLDVAADGDRIGLVANLSIHPVLLGPEWLEVSTDWLGPFRAELEGLVAGTVVELTGSLGDVNPLPPSGRPDLPYDPWATLDETVDYGKRLARAVAGAVGEGTAVDGPLRVLRHETIRVPVGGTGLAALFGEPTMEVDLTEWAIGDVRVVSIPGEAFHALGRAISGERSDRVLLCGLAPWHGYLPLPWGEGYEEGVSYGEAFVRTIGEELTSAPS